MQAAHALCTLHFALCTLHLALCTLHLAPCTLHLAPYTLHVLTVLRSCAFTVVRLYVCTSSAPSFLSLPHYFITSFFFPHAVTTRSTSCSVLYKYGATRIFPCRKLVITFSSRNFWYSSRVFSSVRA